MKATLGEHTAVLKYVPDAEINKVINFYGHLVFISHLEAPTPIYFTTSILDNNSYDLFTIVHPWSEADKILLFEGIQIINFWSLPSLAVEFMPFCHQKFFTPNNRLKYVIITGSEYIILITKPVLPRGPPRRYHHQVL
jgi:hypothetical protein